MHMPSQTDSCSVQIQVFDGTRQPMDTGIALLIRIRDGNQKELVSKFYKKPSILFEGLPFYNNFGDNYAIVVSASGYDQAGFHPVHMSPALVQPVDLMLLPKRRKYDFEQAQWDKLAGANPKLAEILGSGAPSAAAAKKRYEDLMREKPPSMAALLNITTAMRNIHLPQGSPLDYLKQVIWDQSIAQDRFFAWADQGLVQQVRLACAQGVFKPEFGSGLFHPGATSSYKQVLFGEANVQLTFHEQENKSLNGVPCVKLEPDIDYYRDEAAHTILEVIPNLISGGKTDPATIYVLRWIAGRHAGVPEFTPPYSIVKDEPSQPAEGRTKASKRRT